MSLWGSRTPFHWEQILVFACAIFYRFPVWLFRPWADHHSVWEGISVPVWRTCSQHQYHNEELTAHGKHHLPILRGDLSGNLLSILNPLAGKYPENTPQKAKCLKKISWNLCLIMIGQNCNAVLIWLAKRSHDEIGFRIKLVNACSDFAAWCLLENFQIMYKSEKMGL